MSEIPVAAVETPVSSPVHQEVVTTPVNRELSQGELKPVVEQMFKEYQEVVGNWPDYQEAKAKPNKNRHNPYHHIDIPGGKVLAFDEEDNPVGTWRKPEAKSFLLAIRNNEDRHYYEDHTRQHVDNITLSNALSHPKSDTYWQEVWTGGIDEVYALRVNNKEELTYTVIHVQPNPDGTYVYEKNTQAAVDGVKAKLKHIKDLQQDIAQQESFGKDLDTMIHGVEDQEGYQE